MRFHCLCLLIFLNRYLNIKQLRCCQLTGIWCFFPCFSLTAHLFQLADKLFGILRGLRKAIATKGTRKNVSDLSLFLFYCFNNKTQFYKHFLQCRSHYHALLTLNNTYMYAGNAVLNTVIYRKYNYLHYRLLTLLTKEYSAYISLYQLNIKLLTIRYTKSLQYNSTV